MMLKLVKVVSAEMPSMAIMKVMLLALKALIVDSL